MATIYHPDYSGFDRFLAGMSQFAESVAAIRYKKRLADLLGGYERKIEYGTKEPTTIETPVAATMGKVPQEIMGMRQTAIPRPLTPEETQQEQINTIRRIEALSGGLPRGVQTVDTGRMFPETISETGLDYPQRLALIRERAKFATQGKENKERRLWVNTFQKMAEQNRFLNEEQANKATEAITSLLQNIDQPLSKAERENVKNIYSGKFENIATTEMIDKYWEQALKETKGDRVKAGKIVRWRLEKEGYKIPE